MEDIITFGSATIDAFVETDKNTAMTQFEEGKATPYVTYKSGEKILIKHLQFEVGGGGTNTASCFAKLGLKTAYVGAIGNDVNGRLVQEALTRDGVRFAGEVIDGQTNYSIVLDSTLIKDRTILAYKDASERLTFDRLPKLTARWMYTSSLSGVSFATSMRVINALRATGTRIASNPSNYQIEHDRIGTLLLLEHSNVTIMNQDEAIALVGQAENIELLRRLQKLGPNIVVMTLGSKGVCAIDHTRTYKAQPAPDISVRETTGAGDCFAATFVGALALGKDVETALRWGLVNVEEHIQHIGAKAGLLSRNDIEQRVAQDTRSITNA